MSSVKVTDKVLSPCLKVIKNKSTKKRRRSSCTTSEQQQVPPTRTVSFFPSVQVLPIRHVDDYSMEEINTIWTTKEENAENRAECAATCELMTFNGRNYLHDDEEEETGYCARGLEFRTRESFLEKRERKESARVAVLLEQQGQRERKEINEKMIACAYRCHSVMCQEAAHQVGLQDEDVARRLQEEDIDEMTVITPTTPNETKKGSDLMTLSSSSSKLPQSSSQREVLFRHELCECDFESPRVCVQSAAA